jgi:hypothetical protein
MSTARFDELVADYRRCRDSPTYTMIYSMFIIASNLIKEVSPGSTLITNLYDEMTLPSPEIYNRSMEIYASMIFKIGIWKITKDNGIQEDQYVLGSIRDLKYRIQRYESLRDTYDSRNDDEKREYDSLRVDLMRIVGPTFRELLHDQGGNIRLNQ